MSPAVPIHAYEEESISQPVDSLANRRDGPHSDLGVESVGQIIEEPAVDRHVVSEQTKITRKPRLSAGDEDRRASRIVLRPTSPPEYLKHVQNAW